VRRERERERELPKKGMNGKNELLWVKIIFSISRWEVKQCPHFR
jgi:hypothetical protein